MTAADFPLGLPRDLTPGLTRGLTKPLHIDQLLATAAALTGRATGQ